jgi:ElaB/YqjD/DUF883 family membrane-anchored ribosome-binding protein
MDQRDTNPTGSGMGGSANTPPFEGDTPAMRTAADHQIPEDTTTVRASGGRTGTQPKSETERELERTRDMVAKTAAPAIAEKTQEAIEETTDRLAHNPQVKEQVRRTAEAVQHDAQRMAKEKMGEMAGRAEDKVNQGLNQAADRIDQAAHRLDQIADQQAGGAGGPRAKAGQMAHSVADTMESVAGYLRSNDARKLRGDLERQVRERPVQTLLIGVAAGWLAGKILR